MERETTTATLVCSVMGISRKILLIRSNKCTHAAELWKDVHTDCKGMKTSIHTFLNTWVRLMTAAAHTCVKNKPKKHACTPAEQRTLLDYWNSVNFDWFRAFLKHHSSSYSQQPRCYRWKGLCTIFNSKLNSKGFVFGWWSICQGGIFSPCRLSASTASQRSIVPIKITQHHKSWCSRNWEKNSCHVKMCPGVEKKLN